MNTSNDLNAIENYWGTADSAAIHSLIYDSSSNLGVGTVVYNPYLSTPEANAPPFLYQVSLDPGSPVGIQRVKFTLVFSASMDQSVNPEVTFGPAAPHNQFTISDNAQWMDGKTWSAAYDITSLVPTGVQTISVSGAKGLDGMEIPKDTRFSFLVDYAGEITDSTPPNTPWVFASGNTNDISFVMVNWSATDPETSIIGYRYAIGTAPGATDIVNWTNTTKTSISRNGLILIDGHQYWVSIQAQNSGGLWSQIAYSPFVAGEVSYIKAFLPLVIK